jgi:hypothetical protein
MSQTESTSKDATALPPLWRWKKGRQNTGYEALPLVISKLLRLDCYLLRYRQGVGIPPHKDPAPVGARHYRLNVIIWPARKGGDLECESYLFELGPIKFFRPDLALHSVSPVEEGVRYVFSVGWLRGART